MKKGLRLILYDEMSDDIISGNLRPDEEGIATEKNPNVEPFARLWWKSET